MFSVHVVVEGHTVGGSGRPCWSSRCCHVVQWREQTSSVPSLTRPGRLNVHVVTFIFRWKVHVLPQGFSKKAQGNEIKRKILKRCFGMMFSLKKLQLKYI